MFLISTTSLLFPKQEIPCDTVLHFFKHFFGNVSNSVHVFFYVIYYPRKCFGDADKVIQQYPHQYP